MNTSHYYGIIDRQELMMAKTDLLTLMRTNFDEALGDAQTEAQLEVIA
ncbi:hypothetical protein KKH13_04995 [Patescibacteria group bacterium]|nr:hypothetical protein [Patescibacteria group bacterium]